ncbi:cell division protein ZipA [Vibrio sp. D404a]|uniref:cell division protein ZipA n=1 Tax=unclassified Vibrio TaxID=2614977 RepID=UPI0025548AB2|nr:MULTISPECIES: cell division protein ZipA [unclassified Vibrio]MDK9740056.1 cell division protein ZipA [Vibrio sp. D404a]MDK9797704.1 cell division protein ZipA [Vibrio sp. D449a]
MQELRFVLIIVGALAIAALLFHGLWTSKKEGKAKFGDKPLGKLDNDSLDDADTMPERSFAPEDDFEIIRKERKEPDFAVSPTSADPLIDSDPLTSSPSAKNEQADLELNDLPSFSVETPAKEQPESAPVLTPEPAVPNFELTEEQKENHADFKEHYGAMSQEPEFDTQPVQQNLQQEDTAPAVEAAEAAPQEAQEDDLGLEVIVLNVHCAGETPFVGTELFRSMENNGLTYGEMSIYHCFAEAADTPKVIFSVANMMQPGTLEHDNPADFTTKGISFFMTLPCYGQADQNFNVMLSAAQQIADDLGGNVLDESRNLMTPNRLSEYRKQIRDFMVGQGA